MNVVFDSNVWIAYLANDDSQHEKACLLFEKFKAIVVPEYVILEVATVLSQKKDQKTAQSFVKMLRATEGLEILLAGSDLFFEFMDFYITQPKNKLSFVDVSLLYLSSQGLKVVTFDRELEKFCKV